jgi:hypothetical protein
MNASGVVIVSELAQLSRQIERVPKENAIEILPPGRPDQPFDN